VVCHCAIQPADQTTYIVPVNFDLDANGRIKVNAQNRIDKATFSVSPKARGVAYILDPSGRPKVSEDIIFGLVPDLWIVLRGDFVLDGQRRAIDAEFARAELP